MNTYDITSKEIKQLYNNLKASAKKRDIPFDLSPSDIDDIGIPLTCPVLGMPIYFYRDNVQPDSISFDRIDSSKGYSRDNLIIVSYRANKIKSDATLGELEKVFRYYKYLDDDM
jgi:hypothetical protein|tara:strand:+ start:229 stop:570 length:342 start_codon:yes stop_codon:yes gene_type:complete